MSDENTVRMVIHFTGRVQGVGFRYSVLQLAKGYEAAGFAQNLSDGRVRLDVEGSRTELEAFVAAIGHQMAGYIREVSQHEEPQLCHHRGFLIR